MAADAGLLKGLARLALFADFEEPELEELLAIADDSSFPEGDWIVRRGQEEVGLYVIVEGEAGVVFQEVELAVLPPGSFFGEISSLLGEAAVADIVARTRMRCLVIPAHE